MPNLTYSVSFPVAFTKIKSADMTAWLSDIQTLLNTTKLDSTNVQANGLTLDRLAQATSADGFVVANASKNLAHTPDPALPFVNLGADPATPATSHIKLYAKSGKLYTMNETGAVSQVGSGSGGSGGTQYVTNPSAESDTSGWSVYNDTQTVTVTIASPAVVSATAHGLATGDLITLSTTGVLPTGLTAGTQYRVSKIDANSYNLLDTSTGAQINTSGTQSGVHTSHPVQPIDATGGTASATLVRSTTAPLNGTSNFLYTSGQLGEGVSTPLTIERIDLTTPMQIELDMEVASGTYTDGDISIWIVDTVTGVKVQPAPYKVLNAIGPSKFRAEFQGTGNAALKLAVHQTSANSGYTLKFQVTVSSQVVPTGVPVTDWQSFPMVIGATTTAPTKGTISIDNAQWRQVGGSMEITWNYVQTTGGAAGSGTYLFPLPSGAIDTTKLNADGNTSGTIGSAGTGAITDNSSFYKALHVLPYDSTHLMLMPTDGTAAIGTGAGITLATNNYRVSFRASVPIVGWSSNVQVSSASSTREISAILAMASAVTPAANANIKYDTVLWDNAGGYSAATGNYTVSVPGRYKVAVVGETTGQTNFLLAKNGVQQNYLFTAPSGTITSGSASIDCKANDTISVQVAQANPVNGGTPYQNVVSIERISGPSQIAASETIAARAYASSASQAIASGGATTTITTGWNTLDNSTHGASLLDVTTGKITAPIAGRYRIKHSMRLHPAGSWGVGNQTNSWLEKNGTTTVGTGGFYVSLSTAGNDILLQGEDTVPLLAGDYVQVQVFNNGPALDFSNADNGTSSITVERIGN